MTGCDEERERIRQEIAARVVRCLPTLESREQAERLQETYRQRRHTYLKELYGKYPALTRKPTLQKRIVMKCTPKRQKANCFYDALMRFKPHRGKSIVFVGIYRQFVLQFGDEIVQRGR